MRNAAERLLIATLLAVAAQQNGSADAQLMTTVVRGVVVRADSRQPIPGVSVSINLSGASPVMTDAQGRFTFERVPPGRYNVFAYPNGFITSPDGGNQARIVVTATPTPIDVELVLTPFSSISGTVRDPDGRPIAGVRVDVQRLFIRNGRLQMFPAGVAASTTDAEGIYRVSNLYPGEYFVRADPSLLWARSRERERWRPTYFPAAITPTAAIPVNIADGVSVADRNITIQSVPAYAVSGVVDNQLPDAQRLSSTDPLGRVSLFAIARVGGAIDDVMVILDNVQPRQRTPDGALVASDAFELRGLTAGTYDIYPLVRGKLDERDRVAGIQQFTGRTRVTVVDRDVTGVRAVIRRGQDVRLREVSRARAATPTPASDSIAARMLERQMLSLSPKEPIPITVQRRESPPGVGPDAAGIFVIPSVTEGRYDVELDIYYPYPPGEYLADIRQNGRSILDSGVTITQQPPAAIDVMFETGAATITGIVRDARNQPGFDRIVVLLSRAPGRRRVLYSQTVSADSSDTYSFANIAPGDYLVFAPTTTRDWKNSSDLIVRALAPRARAITVGRGATLTVPVEVLDTRTLPPPSRSLEQEVPSR